MKFGRKGKIFLEVFWSHKTHSEIQHFILLSQTGHECVLRQIINPSRILLISSFHLLIQSLNILGKQSSQFERLPLFRRKPSPFVEVWCIEERGASQRTILRSARAEWEVPKPGMLLVRFGLLVDGRHPSCKIGHGGVISWHLGIDPRQTVG
jgi:hypothetical protein